MLLVCRRPRVHTGFSCQWCLSGHRSCRKGVEWHDMHIRPGPLQSPWGSMLVGLQRLQLEVHKAEIATKFASCFCRRGEEVTTYRILCEKPEVTKAEPASSLLMNLAFRDQFDNEWWPW